VTAIATPQDAYENDSKQQGQHSEALLRGRTDPHDPGGAFELDGQFQENVESGHPKAGYHERKGQQFQDGSMTLSSQQADPQHGNNTHDERALVEAQRTRLEAHAHAQPQATCQGRESDQKGGPEETHRGSWL